MAITSPADVSKRKKEQPFGEGFFLDGVDDLTIGVDTTDETLHVHGNAAALAGTTIDNGNVSITILKEQVSAQILLQVITDNDPLVDDDGANASGAKYLNWDNVKSRNIWANMMNNDQTKYLGTIFAPNWVAAPNGPAGAPNDRGRRTFAGRSGIEHEFTGLGLFTTCELIASGNDNVDADTITLRIHSGTPAVDGGRAPVPIPGKTSIYAIGIRAINSGGDSWVTEYIDLANITAAMLDPSGLIGWSTIEAATGIGAGNMNFAMFYLLCSGDGVYPESGGGNPQDFVPDRLTRSFDVNR